MKAFSCIQSRALRLLEDDVDTDQMVPARYLRTASAEGLGPYLFHDRWQGPEGLTFPLHPARYKGEEILIVGANFGCGSSREHAPWALYDFGIRVLIGISFAEIFSSNCLKNGIVPLALPREVYDEILSRKALITVDLQKQILSCGGLRYAFAFDPFARYSLLEGLDELDIMQLHEPAITAFERQFAAQLAPVRNISDNAHRSSLGGPNSRGKGNVT